MSQGQDGVLVGRLGREQSSYTGWNLGIPEFRSCYSSKTSPLMAYMYRLIPKAPAREIYLELYVNAVLIPIYSTSYLKKTLPPLMKTTCWRG